MSPKLLELGEHLLKNPSKFQKYKSGFYWTRAPASAVGSDVTMITVKNKGKESWSSVRGSALPGCNAWGKKGENLSKSRCTE